MAQSEQQFTIMLNGQQLIALMHVTEAYSRMMCGQLGSSLLPVCETAWQRYKYGNETFWDMHDELCEHIKRIRELCWHLKEGSDYGINYSPESNLLWDMYQVIRKFKFDNLTDPEVQRQIVHTIAAEPPMHLSKEPLIKISKI